MNLQTVTFENYKSYISNRKKMFNNIKNTINNWVIIDSFEYEYMIYHGLTSRQRINIDDSLTYELKEFTQHKCDDWCDEITFNIMLGVAGFLDSLVKIKRITDFTPKECATLIYNSIIYQLELDGLLNDIVIISDDSESDNLESDNSESDNLESDNSESDNLESDNSESDNL